MIDYLYDGTFEGLLTCIYRHYYSEKASGIFTEDSYQSSLLSRYRVIDTDAGQASKVYEAVDKKISSYDLRRIYKTFRSSADEKEMKILRYVVMGFKRGSCISMLHGDPVVFAVQQAEKKVGNEAHRLKGLLRFSVLRGGVFYSRVEPDNDVLEFLAGHFCDRFRNDAFIIHDIKRRKALVARDGSWYISDMDTDAIPPADAEEKEFRRLWRLYFNTTAIRERTNPRCQKNFMPQRYWKNLTEMTCGPAGTDRS